MSHPIPSAAVLERLYPTEPLGKRICREAQFSDEDAGGWAAGWIERGEDPPVRGMQMEDPPVRGMQMEDPPVRGMQMEDPPVSATHMEDSPKSEEIDLDRQQERTEAAVDHRPKRNTRKSERRQTITAGTLVREEAQYASVRLVARRALITTKALLICIGGVSAAAWLAALPPLLLAAAGAAGGVTWFALYKLIEAWERRA